MDERNELAPKLLQNQPSFRVRENKSRLRQSHPPLEQVSGHRFSRAESFGKIAL